MELQNLKPEVKSKRRRMSQRSPALIYGGTMTRKIGHFLSTTWLHRPLDRLPASRQFTTANYRPALTYLPAESSNVPQRFESQPTSLLSRPRQWIKEMEIRKSAQKVKQTRRKFRPIRSVQIFREWGNDRKYSCSELELVSCMKQDLIFCQGYRINRERYLIELSI